MSGSFVASRALRRSWHAVAVPATLLDGPLGVTVLGERLVVWCAPDGRVAAKSRDRQGGPP